LPNHLLKLLLAEITLMAEFILLPNRTFAATK